MISNRKEMQRTRMWHYFLGAATEIMEEEGIDHVTIRKIADRAGFTSSTAYNYFKDVTHLKFFAAMRFTTGYMEDLPSYMDKGNNTLEKWLYSWECFCHHSFQQPKIYSVIFIENLGSIAADMLNDYYQIYQHDLIGLPKPIQSIIMEHDFSKRSSSYLQHIAEEGFIETKDVALIADITLMLWKGMMSTFMNQRRLYTVEEATDQTLHYIYESVIRMVHKDKQEEVNFRW
ncbi:TetR family transcriptional regulator [Oceanobacillus locisalsi]|uniref:TetR family transcriptional regulator n=1 Tax=Oceanobacillus locisalsi TaxID=546107 RepID=A0ABW3NKL7_9BACI